MLSVTCSLQWGWRWCPLYGGGTERLLPPAADVPAGYPRARASSSPYTCTEAPVPPAGGHTHKHTQSSEQYVNVWPSSAGIRKKKINNKTRRFLLDLDMTHCRSSVLPVLAPKGDNKALFCHYKHWQLHLIWFFPEFCLTRWEGYNIAQFRY